MLKFKEEIVASPIKVPFHMQQMEAPQYIYANRGEEVYVLTRRVRFQCAQSRLFCNTKNFNYFEEQSKHRTSCLFMFSSIFRYFVIVVFVLSFG